MQVILRSVIGLLDILYTLVRYGMKNINVLSLFHLLINSSSHVHKVEHQGRCSRGIKKHGR